MSQDLHYLTVSKASQLIRQHEITPSELTEAVLKRIDRVETRVRAYVTTTPELARKQASSIGAHINSGTNPLAGIPAAIKDNICTKGIPTTCSSRMLENFVPPYDAHVVTKLTDIGMIMMGKTNMDEFAMGSSTENSAFFPTHNPWSENCVPGGSSGGSAAAVAAGEALYALGSDTGGSIRQPAALCGIVGLKPTYGLISRYGLVAFASSLDQIGSLTRNVEDCSLVLSAIAGHDPRDSTSLPYPIPDYSQSLTGDISGLRLGVPREFLGAGVAQEIKDSLFTAIRQLETMGAQVDWNTSLPSTSYALAVYYILAPSEASANLARYDGVKYGYSDMSTTGMWEAMENTRASGFGQEVKRRILLGTFALSAGYYDAYYLKAQKVRTLIRQEFEEAFTKYDALVTPTSPTLAFKIGERLNDPINMYLSDICTIPANIAGIPSLSLPCGFAEGLPVGMQLIGPALSEPVLLRIGHAYEQVTDWHEKRPLL